MLYNGNFSPYILYLTPIGCSFLRDEFNIEEGTLARSIDVTFTKTIPLSPLLFRVKST
jgi:hypothetical protein